MLSSLVSRFRRNSDAVEETTDFITSDINVLEVVVESMDSNQNMDVHNNDDISDELNLRIDSDGSSASSQTYVSPIYGKCDADQECEEPHHISMHSESTSTSAQCSQKIMNSVAVQCDLINVVTKSVQCEPVEQVTQSVQCDPKLVKSQSVQCELSSLVTRGVQCEKILGISQAVQCEPPCISSSIVQNKSSESWENIVSSSQTSIVMYNSQSSVSEENVIACKPQDEPSQDCDSTKSPYGDGDSDMSTSGHVSDLEKKTKKVARKRKNSTVGKKHEINASPKKREKIQEEYSNLTRVFSQDSVVKINSSEVSHTNIVQEMEKSNKNSNEISILNRDEIHEETALSTSKHKRKRDEDYTAEELLSEMDSLNELSVNNKDCRNAHSGDLPGSENEETEKNTELAEQNLHESTPLLDVTLRCGESGESSENQTSQLLASQVNSNTQWFNSLACERASSPESINENTIEELSKPSSKCHRQLHLKVMKKNTKCLDDDDDDDDTNYQNQAGPQWHQKKKMLKKARDQHLHDKTRENDQELRRRKSSKLLVSSENEPNKLHTTLWFNSLACERASSPESIDEDAVEDLRESPRSSYRQSHSEVVMKNTKDLDDNAYHQRRSGLSPQKKPRQKLRSICFEEEPKETNQEPCERRRSKLNKSLENEQVQLNPTELSNSLACEQASSPEIFNDDSIEELENHQSYCYHQLLSKETNAKGLHDNTNSRNRAGPSWQHSSPLKRSKDQYLQDHRKTSQESYEKRKHSESKSTPAKAQLVPYSESDCDTDNSSSTDSRKEKHDSPQTKTVSEEESAHTPVRKSGVQGVVRRSPKRKPERPSTRYIRDLRYFDDSDSDIDSSRASTVTYRTTVSTRSTKSQTRRSYTEREREAIISYIIDHRCFKLLKGRSFWENMEKANICPARTWQSLKEHFRKQIIPNIEEYDLDPSVLKKFKSIWK